MAPSVSRSILSAISVKTVEKTDCLKPIEKSGLVACVVTTRGKSLLWKQDEISLAMSCRNLDAFAGLVLRSRFRPTTQQSHRANARAEIGRAHV